MTIKDRIIQLIEYKSIPKENFYIKIGMTSASFRGDAKKRPLNSNAIENILSEIPDVNPIWLLTGKGQMLRNTEDSKSVNLIHTPRISDKKIETQTVPLYDIEATAGLKELFDDKSQHIIDAISIPNLPKCDGAIYTTGDSMYPILKSGDIILYKEITVALENIFFGEMYLLSIQLEDEEYITVKYIQRSEIPNCIRLVSHNPHHDPKDVPMSSITALAIVKASIRMHTIL